MDVAGYRSEWRTDFQFGGTHGMQTELFRPFTPLNKWFFAPFLNVDQNPFDIYYKRDPRSIYRQDRVLGGIAFGYSFNRLMNCA
jgi:hypothetical protein